MHHTASRRVETTRDPASRKTTRVSWMFAIWVVIGAVWLRVLPWVAAQPAVSARLAELDSKGIDPSAMFYSELPAMADTLAEIDALHQRSPRALWDPRDVSHGPGRE